MLKYIKELISSMLILKDRKKNDDYLNRPSLRVETTLVETEVEVPEYDVVNWISIDYQWEESPTKSEGTPYEGFDQTAEREGTCLVPSLLTYPGTRGERRRWRTITKVDGTTHRIFGKYSESEWYEFLDKMKQGVVTDPVMIYVDKSGKVSVADGNHRREASIQLGIKEIPVRVYYFGDSQLNVTKF